MMLEAVMADSNHRQQHHVGIILEMHACWLLFYFSMCLDVCEELEKSLHLSGLPCSVSCRARRQLRGYSFQAFRAQQQSRSA